MQDAQFPQEWTAEHLESPFAETVLEQSTTTPSAVDQLSETVSPFAEAFADLEAQFDEHGDFEDILGELHDETFNEALAYLADETERDIYERFAGETGQFQSERERYGEARLAEVRYEAEHYLDTLAEALANQDLGSLGEDRLSEVLDRLDPASSETTPAGEEFIGALVRKAKKVVKTVVNTAKKVGSLASPLLAPVLAKLRGLVQPLLRRVLSFAIGRLPAQLQSAARQLASRMRLETELEELEATTSPTNLIDVEALAEDFDATLAEAMFAPAAEDNEYGEIDEADHGNSLAALAEARGMLIDNLREAGEKDNLAPAIEQFVPALLGALRLGIRLVGRPKVVGFLAGYLSKMIGRWVEPRASGALSNAIADAGLKLMTLEAEDRSALEAADREAAPVALATVVEDTIRRLAEHEEFVFDNEDLMQLAAAESFSQAIATHFPPRFVRADLQRAPTLDGTFVARRPRNLRAYRKFSRVPEVDVTSQLADELPTFGGATLGSTLRAAGATLPMRARMHIYQAAPGTTLASIGRLDRTLGSIRGALSPASFHPLTPQAAGLLLREPKLGTPVSNAFLRTPNRIGAGQRFYVLQPADGMSALPVAGNPGTLQRLTPSRAWLAFNGRKGTALVGIYFSESEAQQIVSAIRKGNGTAPLLRAIVDACRTIGLSLPSRLSEQEGVEVQEEFAGKMARLIPPNLKHLFRRRLASWVLPAISNWIKANGETFARAAGHPDPGVTIRIKIEAPLLAQIPQAIKSGGLAVLLRGARPTPSISISVTPGRRRK